MSLWINSPPPRPGPRSNAIRSPEQHLTPSPLLSGTEAPSFRAGRKGRFPLMAQTWPVILHYEAALDLPRLSHSRANPALGSHLRVRAVRLELGTPSAIGGLQGPPRTCRLR